MIGEKARNGLEGVRLPDAALMFTVDFMSLWGAREHRAPKGKSFGFLSPPLAIEQVGNTPWASKQMYREVSLRSWTYTYFSVIKLSRFLLTSQLVLTFISSSSSQICGSPRFYLRFPFLSHQCLTSSPSMSTSTPALQLSSPSLLDSRPHGHLSVTQTCLLPPEPNYSVLFFPDLLLPRPPFLSMELKSSQAS